jgi:hypothetical protein
VSVEYNDSLKTTRMQHVADAIGLAGILQLLSVRYEPHGVVVRTVLVEFPLDVGEVDGDTLTLPLLENESACIASGIATTARITNSLGFVVADNMSIGPASPASVILNNQNLTVGQHVRLYFARIHHAD